MRMNDHRPDWLRLLIVVQLVILTVIVASILILTRVAHGAVECHASKGASGYWAWRIIDGRRCWYRGKRGMSKSNLTWRQSDERDVRAPTPRPRPDVVRDRMDHGNNNGPWLDPGPGRKVDHLRSNELFPRPVVRWIEQPIYVPAPAPRVAPVRVATVSYPRPAPEIGAWRAAAMVLSAFGIALGLTIVINSALEWWRSAGNAARMLNRRRER